MFRILSNSTGGPLSPFNYSSFTFCIFFVSISSIFAFVPFFSLQYSNTLVTTSVLRTAVTMTTIHWLGRQAVCCSFLLLKYGRHVDDPLSEEW